MKTVTYKTVMDWNPCTDFPANRIDKLFEGKEAGTLKDLFSIDMRQDEHLWIALREAFFDTQELKNMAARFVLHVSDLANYNDPTVTGAVLNATMAASGNLDLLPKDRRHERWATGATPIEKRTALSALWSAIARANVHNDKEKRLKAWNKERDWQISFVKEKAGI